MSHILVAPLKLRASLGGGRWAFGVFLLFAVTLLNDKVCERDIAIKLFEV